MCGFQKIAAQDKLKRRMQAALNRQCKLYHVAQDMYVVWMHLLVNNRIIPW